MGLWFLNDITTAGMSETNAGDGAADIRRIELRKNHLWVESAKYRCDFREILYIQKLAWKFSHEFVQLNVERLIRGGDDFNACAFKKVEIMRILTFKSAADDESHVISKLGKPFRQVHPLPLCTAGYEAMGEDDDLVTHAQTSYAACGHEIAIRKTRKPKLPPHGWNQLFSRSWRNRLQRRIRFLISVSGSFLRSLLSPQNFVARPSYYMVRVLPDAVEEQTSFRFSFGFEPTNTIS